MLPRIDWWVGHHHVMLSTWYLCVAVGVVVATVLAIRGARRPDIVVGAVPIVLASALVGARLVAWAVPAFGWSSMGGILGALIAIVVGARIFGASTNELLQAIAPAALVGFACGRLGCWLAGCCYGVPVPSSLPWAVVMPAVDAVPRHPAALYAIAGDLLAATWAYRGSPDARARRAVLGYALVRTTVETVRDARSTSLLGTGPFTVPQLACVVLGAWAVWSLSVTRRVDGRRLGQ